MSTFALVHGAWHGVTPVLPSEETELGLEDYANTIAAALGDADDLVLVPHSLGGLAPAQGAGLPLGTRARAGSQLLGAALCGEQRLRPQAQRSQAEPSPAPPERLRGGSIIGANDRVVSYPELLADALAQLDSE